MGSGGGFRSWVGTGAVAEGGLGGTGGSVDGGGREVVGGNPAVEEVTVSGELGGEMSNPAPFPALLPGSGFHSGILGWTPLCVRLYVLYVHVQQLHVLLLLYS